jgi:hypothetical protein
MWSGTTTLSCKMRGSNLCRRPLLAVAAVSHTLTDRKLFAYGRNKFALNLPLKVKAGSEEEAASGK